MAWRVVRSLAALRAAFDTRFPGRDHTTDGSIGDTAHQSSPSGHNPDDTPGSLPESNDADNEAEVRAIDVDADLREAAMWDVVQAILATPTDRDRLLYIIHRRKIWSKSQGWRERTYTGGDTHDGHAHFSGDPAYDEDTRPWTSVLSFGQSTQEEDEMRPVREPNGSVWIPLGTTDWKTKKLILRPVSDPTVWGHYVDVLGDTKQMAGPVDWNLFVDERQTTAVPTATVDAKALAAEVAKLLPKPLTFDETVAAVNKAEDS